MKPKVKLKITIDILMTLSLLFSSGYQLWGEAAHEWAGAILFVLFIAHHLLNASWHKNLTKGHYTPMRVLQLLTDLALFAIMLIQMYSGIVLSRHVFVCLPITSGMALARRLHILGAYWGYLLMSLHIGLHWNMLIGMAKKGMRHSVKAARLSGRKDGRAEGEAVAGSRRFAPLPFSISTAIALYGMYVFIKRDFITYLFLKSEFVFLDYEEPKILFYLDYLALMGGCIFLAHYGAALFRKKRLVS